MANSIRTRKVSSVIRAELATMISRELKDPRVEAMGFVTVSGIDLSPDHRNATVYVSFMGRKADSKAVKEAVKGLNNAAPYMHRQLKKRLSMRSIPQLLFRYDEMFDRAAAVAPAFARAQEIESQTPTNILNN